MRRRFLFLLLVVILAAGCGDDRTIREGFVANGGHTLYTKTMGSGDPVVVLHGGPGFDHRQFLPFIWELARGHQVILYDQRCTGLSSGPADSASLTIEAFIADLEAVRQAFGIEKMNLVGHSWGGILAMHYALEHGDRLQSLVLCSTAAADAEFAEMSTNYERNRIPGDADKLVEIYRSAGYAAGDPAVIEQFWRIYFKPYFKDQSQVQKLDLRFTGNTIRNSAVVADGVQRSILDFDLHDDLKALRCPTLILHGDADPLPVQCAERLHESIAGSELVIVEGAGHWLFVDGTEEFSRSILGFLERVAKEQVSGPP